MSDEHSVQSETNPLAGEPAMSQLLDSTEESARRLKRTLHEVRERARLGRDRDAIARLRSKALIHAAGLRRTSALDLARLATRDKPRLDADDHERLVRWLWREGYLDGSHVTFTALRQRTHAVFDALVPWFGSSRDRIVELGQRLTGEYRFWQPSAQIRGQYDTGIFRVAMDTRSGVLSATMRCPVASAYSGDALERTLAGYAIGEHAGFHVLLRGESESAFVTARGVLIHGAYQILSGCIAGAFGGVRFACAWHAQRVPSGNEAPVAACEVVEPAAIPLAVKASLAGTACGLVRGLVEPGDSEAASLQE